ncbi:NAD(P)H-dependent glycerol-3-phosphate dehydrogenase [Wenzhouxiangella marina]|uniref:Glycerol-3-phosphate dehydrogenase [NAD(P)+] n=1 Tax=Wenzhouxiangella marina TaxID=1579979 RepID=A0A0K0XWB8_9GAMM|nr:NAD(P)H-dependent glycerol-3-phosphate dehydrogenase [Wenzhouxiangella marina]AKS41973.1 glycerol-3-phosphate dehydrogenase [NAD(P)+] [Wenzhouxiangella marina]MBB6086260.1 glycerol-3-phosphate dehydrogenase (NAD(P)+) [Wenzhouxiangella marina]
MSARIAVLGAGSWGTALALQLARQGHEVRLWARDPAQAEAMQRDRVNERYLPGFALPENLSVSADFDACLADVDRLLVVTPSHAFPETLERLAPHLTPEMGLAWASKGFEPGSGRLLHVVAEERFGTAMPLALITGPSFAKEVAAGLPTAVTVAASSPEFGETWAGLLHGSGFRAYYTSDLTGAELGGAVKNVLAVACGMADGLELGANTRAALITRGLAETMRLGKAMDADPRTLMGLAGIGDLVLTCTGDLSRNRRLGLALGRGQSVDEAVAEIGQVVEGIKTSQETMRLAERYGVDMPITEQVHGILFKGWNARTGVKVLMERDLKRETE